MDTEPESVHGESDYNADPKVTDIMEGSEDKETVVTCKKSAKVTCHLIEAAHATKAKLDTKAVTLGPIASILPPTGKRKLKHKGV